MKTLLEARESGRKLPALPRNKSRGALIDSHTTNPSPELHRSPQQETEQDGGGFTLPLLTHLPAPPVHDLIPSPTIPAPACPLLPSILRKKHPYSPTFLYFSFAILLLPPSLHLCAPLLARLVLVSLPGSLGAPSQLSLATSTHPPWLLRLVPLSQHFSQHQGPSAKSPPLNWSFVLPCMSAALRRRQIYTQKGLFSSPN